MEVSVETLFEDLENVIKSSGLITLDNFQWLESEDKASLPDASFPRIEVNQNGEDELERLDQCKLHITYRFALGFYFRWTSFTDTPAKAKDRLLYIESQKKILRQTIFSLEMLKQAGTLTCKQFEQVADGYEINVIHEFIPLHSTITFYFGLNVVENPYK